MTATTFYRTLHGDHAHVSISCANAYRAIRSGDPILITADELKDFSPCTMCCSFSQAAEIDQVRVAKPAGCRNSGVANNRRMRSTCTDCGKEGAVNRSTGTLRAHAPQA